MRGLQRSFWMVLAVTLAAIIGGNAPASAQTYPWRSGDFRVESDGSGKMQGFDRDGSSELRRVTVSLQRNGRAEVTLGESRRRTSLLGRWRDDGSDRDGARLRLDLDDRVNGDSVRTDARLILRRVVTGLTEQWNISRLVFSTDTNGRTYSAEFRGRDASDSDDRWNEDRRGNDRGNGRPDDRNDDRWNGGGGGYGADRLNQFSGETRGDGTLREGNDRRDLDRVMVRLDRDGRADITVYGRTTSRFEGRWRRVNDETADIRLTQAFGRDVREGRGRIEFRNAGNRGIRLRSLELSGRTNRDFEVRFNQGRDEDGNGNGNGNGGSSDTIAFDNSSRGRGTVRRNGRDEMSLRRVSVVLRKSGQAQITLEGDRGDKETISGRWTRTRDDQFQITVVAAFGSNNANGTGQLYLRRGKDIERLQLGGVSSGRAWALDFDAD